MKEYYFNLHGVTAKLLSDNSSVANDIREEIKEFEISFAGNPEIHVNFLSDTESSESKILFKKSEKITDTVYSFVDIKQFIGTVTATKDYSRDEAVLVTLSLIGYLLRFRLAVLNNVTAIHSASFGLGDSGVLVSGHSGAGKTTISCSFLENNFNYLSDEDTLVEKKKGKLSLLSFPRNLRLGEEFINSIEGRHISKSYPLKRYEAFYEKGWILNPRNIRAGCMAEKQNLSLCVILNNSDNQKELRIKPLKDISALYRIISLLELLSPEDEDKEVYSQLQIYNEKAFEIANFLFDTIPLYEIEYNLKSHFRELPGKVKELLEDINGKESIRKNTCSEG